MGNTTLKPCPFCGKAEAEVERVGDARQSCIVACGWCGCRLESGERGAGSDWNRRPAEDALVAATRHARDFFASNARALRLSLSPRDRVKAEHYEAHQAVMEAALGEAEKGGAP